LAPPVPKKPHNPHKVAAAEQRVGELEAQLAELDRQLADPANYADTQRMAEFGRDRDAVAARLAEAEQQWLELMG
jgi:ATP-binding cassette, subfamily F, member 3